MKKILVIMLVLFISILSGCNIEKAKDTEKYTPKEYPPLTIVMPKTYVFAETKAQTEYAEKLLQEYGFNIEFEIFGVDLNGNDYFKKYAKYINSSNENTVFIAVDNLFDTNLLDISDFGDFYQQGQENAPRYTLTYAEMLNSPNAFVKMPSRVNVDNGNIPRMAVLIKDEIYTQYGKDISTASEYKELLNFAKEKTNTPGLMYLLDHTAHVTILLL